MRCFHAFMLSAVLMLWSNRIVAQVDGANARLAAHSGTSTNSSSFFQSNLMDKYDISYLKLEIDITPASLNIAGVCSYLMKAIQPIDTFAIEFKNTMNLDSVFINEVPMAFTRGNDHIYVALATPISTNTTFTTRFVYSGIVVYGLAYGKDQTSGLTFAATVSECFQARDWYPAKQLLNYKIDSTDIWLTTPNPYKAGANGLLKAVVPMPGNKTQFRWSTRTPMAYYQPCMAAGNYTVYNNYAKPAALNGDSILIQHWVSDSAGYLATIQPFLDKTPIFLEQFSQLYGLYPFYQEKYGHLHANIGGGMEHQTSSTMASFGLELIAHELGHQWYGNDVTCGTWQDIWLNEGFATYSAYLMREKNPSFYITTAQADMLNKHQNIMSQPGGVVYLPLTSAYNEGRIFSGRLSYDKGAAVLHNLRFELQSDSLFFNILRTYRNQFRAGFAVTNDFKTVAEQVSGRDLTDFFNQWVYGQGFPTYKVGYYKWGADTLVLNISQTVSLASVTPLFKGLMQYKIQSAGGDTIILLNQTASSQTFRIPYSKIPTGVVVDPNNWVIDGTAIVLPLRLNSFTGSLNNGKALLQWNTSAEVNMKAFELQRAADGQTFQTIATIAPRNSGGQYNYTDELPLARNYYRLKMVDLDGAFTTSHVVQLNKATAQTLSLSYQPTASNLIITASLPESELLQLTVYNMEGKKMMQRSHLSANASGTRISLASLPQGMYVAMVEGTTQRQTIKLKR